MATGRIARFDATNESGFIIPDGGGDEVYFSLEDSTAEVLGVGMAVRFSCLAGRHGPTAYNLSVVDDEVLTEAVESSFHLGFDYVEIDIIRNPFEYGAEITNVLISAMPEITGRQIAEVRSELIERAAKRGWIAEAS
jgi:CspA family cold shock protein